MSLSEGIMVVNKEATDAINKIRQIERVGDVYDSNNIAYVWEAANAAEQRLYKDMLTDPVEFRDDPDKVFHHVDGIVDDNGNVIWDGDFVTPAFKMMQSTVLAAERAAAPNNTIAAGTKIETSAKRSLDALGIHTDADSTGMKHAKGRTYLTGRFNEADCARLVNPDAARPLIQEYYKGILKKKFEDKNIPLSMFIIGCNVKHCDPGFADGLEQALAPIKPYSMVVFPQSLPHAGPARNASDAIFVAKVTGPS